MKVTRLFDRGLMSGYETATLYSYYLQQRVCINGEKVHKSQNESQICIHSQLLNKHMDIPYKEEHYHHCYCKT